MRKHLKGKLKLKGMLGLVLILFFAVIVKVFIDTNTFKVNQIEFQTEKMPPRSKLTILQLSDLHNKVFGADNEKLVAAAAKLDPDLIVITGDLIDRKTEDFTAVYSLIERLTRNHSNIFFVSGNHEWGRDIPTEEFLLGLEERGATILNNKHIQLQINDTLINLAGVDDAATNHENIGEAFAQIEEEAYTILLSHSPAVVERYDDIPADLILSGHTHGGQVRLPIVGAVITPDEGLFPKYDKGVYEINENQYLYIDSGLGTSIIPVRFLNQSGMSMVTVRSERAS